MHAICAVAVLTSLTHAQQTKQNKTQPNENQCSRTHLESVLAWHHFLTVFYLRFHLQIIILQLNESMRTGQWLILQSGAHTKTQIIKRINHLLDIDESNEFHRDFRLWIIVMETKAFPLEMLQRSFKGFLFTIYSQSQ